MPPTLTTGLHLGVYELIEQLGAGGMGVVWRAHDERLGRDVALKLIPPDLAEDPEAAIRFEREARGLAALSHPNIVSIYDFGDERGVRFIVTELLTGETLRDALRRGPLPWRTAAGIAAEIADGLAAAHEAGILHRDLKPENIFLLSNGRVKILDFGLAKDIRLPSPEATTIHHQTEPGRVLGTLGYTSPEQLRAEETLAASDLFSVGCMVWEMCTGVPAFLRNSSAETIAAILVTDLPALDTVAPVPPELARITARCVEKAARDRFQSARDLAFALRDAGGAATRPGAAVDRVKPRRWQGIVVATVIALTVVGAGAFFATRARRAEEPSIPARATIRSLAVLPFDASPEFAWAREGIAEAVFRRLGAVPQLRVTAPHFDSIAPVVRDGHVLRGKISGAGKAVKVEAEIVDGATSAVVWRRTWSDADGQLLSIERQLASDVALFAEPSATTQSTTGATVDPVAHREYLTGRHQWNKFTAEGFERALEHFQRSIDRDPSYALAYAGMSDAYAMLGFHGGRIEEMMPKSHAAALRATQLDPQLGEAYTSLGTALALRKDRDWVEAERAMRRGIELNPRSADAHHIYAVYLGIVGRFDEALKEIRLAHALDPLSLVIYLDLAWTHYIRGEDTEAIEWIEKAVRHDPRSALAREEASWYYDRMGRHEQSLDALEAAAGLGEGDVGEVQMLRSTLRREGTVAYLRRRHELAVKHERPYTHRAALSLLLGDKERALGELEEAVRRMERDIVYLKSSPSFNGLASEPRYQALLRELQFPR